MVIGPWASVTACVQIRYADILICLLTLHLFQMWIVTGLLVRQAVQLKSALLSSIILTFIRLVFTLYVISTT